MNVYSLAASALLLVTLSAFAPARAAADRGWFMGGAWGIATYRDGGDFDTQGDLDDRDGTTQIFGGYRFGKYFALEGRFTDLGDYGLSTDDDKYSFEFSAWSLHGLGIYPFGQSGLEVYGQIGLGTLSREIKLREGSGPDDAESNSLLSAGLAFRYTPPKLPSITFLLLGYDWWGFEARAQGGTERQSIHAMRIGLQYNF